MRFSRLLAISLLFAPHLALGASFTPLGQFYPTGVSADGSVVAGWGSGSLDLEAFRWSGGSVVGLGAPEGFNGSLANGLSDDGAVTAGELLSDTTTEAFR